MGMGVNPVSASASSPMRSLVRALEVLEHLASSPVPLGVSELARATGIPKTSVHRILAVLSERGMAVPHRQGFTALAGPRDYEEATRSQARDLLRRNLTPFLVDLYDLTRDVVLLGVLDRDEVDVIAAVYSHRGAALSPGRAHRRNLHSAMGAVLVAFGPDLVVPNVIGTRVEATISASRSADVVLRIRSTGFAVCECDDSAELVEVAVPVSAPDGVVATIGRLRRAGAGDDRGLRWQRRIAASASARLRAVG